MVIVIYYNSTTGHAALSLTGLGQEQNIHISLYPGNSKSQNIPRLHGIKFDGMIGLTDIVVLPSEESCGYGLSEKAIYAWWKNEYQPHNEPYRFFGGNCATLAWRALCIGQEKSKTFDFKSLPYSTYTISFPTNILTYAKEISRYLVTHHKDNDPIYTQYLQLKEITSIDKENMPYSQAVALSLRLKEFETGEFCLMANKPFCEGIVLTLKAFRLAIEQKNDEELKTLKLEATILDKLIILLNIDTLPAVDVNAHYKHLRELGDYICQLPNETSNALFTLFQTVIKTSLLTKMKTYLETVDPHHIKEEERLKQVFGILEAKIEDENNPHRERITLVDDLPRAYLW